MISAPQFRAPVTIIRIELMVTPARANIKNKSRVPELSSVSTAAPEQPSLLKKLFQREHGRFSRRTVSFSPFQDESNRRTTGHTTDIEHRGENTRVGGGVLQLRRDSRLYASLSFEGRLLLVSNTEAAKDRWHSEPLSNRRPLRRFL